MTDKQLRKLSRTELLELLLEQTQEVERLQNLCDRALKQLENRRLILDETGSVAMASLQLNGVFESAQKAADQYLYNVQQMTEEKQRRLEQMESETQKKCQDMLRQAQAESETYWNTVYNTMLQISRDQPQLRDYLNSVIPPELMRKKRFYEDKPSSAQLAAELKRVRYKKNYNWVLRSTVYTLITVAAVAVLVATLFLPVLQIYGNSMAPTLNEGDIVFAVKRSELTQGDVVSFYYNNKILVKRVIAGPGSWVNIDEDGVVYVDGKPLEEPYVNELALGECNIELPYQVPDGRYFVMGDHRATSVDSRNTAVGCVSQEMIVGKIVFRIWPLDVAEPL